ncbi:hypothetical protein HGG71_02850 [Rhodobacteraceae bacterium R_SAG2]|nr:hypothetical protein [Rhodobacteraceae bacterium R_SAG2]
MPETVTPLSELCWGSDIEIALLSVARSTLVDREYWFATVDLVESGIDPETNQKITMSGLEAWVARCKAHPAIQEAHDDADNKTRRVSPSGRHVPHS